jgi:uncharacterized protein YdaU (DUF1376 family)
MHYYQFNIGDYARDTVGISLIEDIAYRRLIDNYHLNEKPLNGCSTHVARIIGMKEYIDEVGYVLNRFFRQDDQGFWSHKRIEQNILEYRQIKKVKIDAGKASGKARKAKALQQVLNTCSSDGELTNNHKPITINQEQVTSKKPIRSKAGILLADYLNDCKAKGEKPISSDDPLFAYCEQAGIPDDYTALAWRVFKDAHLSKSKKYIDWKAAFRNAVKQDWYKLWAIDREGNFYLTTAGKQAEAAHFGEQK